MFNCSKDRETITHLDALAIYFECQAHFREWFTTTLMVNLHPIDTRIFLTHDDIIISITWTKSPLAESCPRLTLSMASLITRLTGSSTMTQVPVSDLARHLLTCIITISLLLTNIITFVHVHLPAEVGVQAVDAVGQLYAVTAADLPLTLITVIITGHSGHLEQDQVWEYHWWEQIAGLHVFWVPILYSNFLSGYWKITKWHHFDNSPI